MIRRFLTPLVFVTSALSFNASVCAQAPANSHNPAVKSSAPVAVTAPAHGASSFTRDQARGRLAKAGYTNVTRLTKDRNGAWMASAMKDGQKVNVALDYKGNITTR